jgi:hypothetical protein
VAGCSAGEAPIEPPPHPELAINEHPKITPAHDRRAADKIEITTRLLTKEKLRLQHENDNRVATLQIRGLPEPVLGSTAYGIIASNFREKNMLQMRPNCECCDRDLPPESADARICSFECTFCAACADTRLNKRCPNCGGELLARPRRPASTLAKFPASSERIKKPQGCISAASSSNHTA